MFNVIWFISGVSQPLYYADIVDGVMPEYKGETPKLDYNGNNYYYEFDHFEYREDNSEKEGILLHSYVAEFNLLECRNTITFNLNGGRSTTNEALTMKVNDIKDIDVPVNIKKSSYVFKGFEYNGVKVYDEYGKKVSDFELSSNMTFNAIYEKRITLTINYSIYDPTTNKQLSSYTSLPSFLGDVSTTSYYDWNTYVDLHAYPKEGYTFVGWYNNGQVLSNEKDYKYMMWDEDFTIEARFKYTLYDLNVWSNNPNLGQVIIKNGNSQVFYDNQTLKKYYSQYVTIVAYTKSDSARFLGWYDENNKLVSTNASYDFYMPNKNYKLEAKWDFFNVTYDLDGGINNENNPSYYSVDMENITLLNPTKEGYTFQGWEYNGNAITEINTSNACHMNLKALWTYYTLTTNINNSKAGTISSYNNIKITKGEEVILEAITNPGYTFNGWFDGDNLVSPLEIYKFNMPAESLSYTAKWTANTDTAYKVEHYLQNIDNNNYPSEPFETDNLNGTTDTLTNGEVNIYEGFTTPTISQVNIKGNGTTVIRLYYTRNSYDLSLNRNNSKAGTIIGESGTYKFDKEIKLEAKTNPGYTFNGWFDGDIIISDKSTYTFAIPAKNLKYTAKWTANTDTAYKVEHYQQKIDNNTYELYETDYLTGTTDTLTNGEVNIYEGFGFQAITQVNIKGDGSTVIKLYYPREYYTITLIRNNSKAGTVTGSGTYKYEKTITITATTNPGYTFDGWFDGDIIISDKSTYTFAIPAKNLKYTAKWTANTDTAYKVEHYLQNIDNVNYPSVPEDTDNLIGTTDTLTNGEAKIYEGFKTPTITQININGDGSTVLKIYYQRNNYIMSLSKNIDKAGIISGANSYKYNKEITISVSTNPGYTFNGWFDGEELVYSKETYTFNMPASNLDYTAKWTANTDTAYKVEHYLQNVNYLTPYETDYLTGTTDTLTNGEVNIYEGFTTPEITQVNINGDGSTVIKLYYTRNSYDLELSVNNDKAGTISNLSGTYKFEKEITIIATTNPGYTFNGWYDGNNLISPLETYTFNMPAKNLSYTAKWTANTDTAYKVEHYLQNIDDENYPTTPFETDNLTGTTDTLTNGEVNIYEGFTSPEITQININGDESTVIRLYYTRNNYIVSLNKNIDAAGTITGAGTYKYGKEIIIIAETNQNYKTGYIFGWYADEKLVSLQESFTFTVAAKNITYTAKWIAITETPYTVEHYLQNLNDENYPSAPEDIDLLTGTTDTLTNGEVYIYEGFTTPEITQVNINGDGSTVIKLYYTRNSYDLELSVNNDKAGTISNLSGTYKFEKEITIIATTNPGYTFNGWFDGDNLVSPLETYTFNMPAESLAYIAKWSANADTAYKVEHYLQNIDDENYPSNPYETDNLTGTTDTLTNGEVNTYEGFTSPEITQININGDESTVIRLYYIRNSYEITLSINNDKAGTITDISGTYKYDKTITITVTTNPGYTFNGWYDGDNLVSPLETYTFNMPAKNLSYTAKWTANTDTAYKVEHYLQNIDDENYPTTPFETDNLTGTTDTLTNGELNTYEGFTTPEITQVNIDGDGTTVIRLYYTRNSYEITLSINNDKAGTITDVSGNYKFEKEITITAETNPGYTFNGWYDGGNLVSPLETYTFNMPTENLSYIAKWTANTDTAYKVEHYLQKTNGSYPTTPFETDKLTGTTDTLTNGEVNTYEGFTSPEITQVNINGDGSTVIKLLYTRNNYEISLSKNITVSGTVTGAGSYKYDDLITITATNPGYTFNGWYDGDNLVSSKVNYKFYMPAKNLSYTAMWTANIDTKYKVEHYLQKINDSYSTTPYETDNLTGTTNTLTNGEVNTYEGFTSPTITQVNIDGDGSTVIKLYYTRNSYDVSLSKNIDKAGTITGAGTYKYEKVITITATTNTGYTFDGWYKNDELYSSDSSCNITIGSSNEALEARYIVNQYRVYYSGNACGATIYSELSGVYNGSKQDFDKLITLKSIYSGKLFLIWTIDEKVVHVGKEYSFNMPASDIIIRVVDRFNDKVYFGSYPQTKVEDDSLKTELNASAGELPSSTNLYKWIDYNYYYGKTQSSYMYYQDIDFDNDGTYDYRGVYFTKNRTFSVNSYTSISYQADNGYTIGEIYWFSYDPIEWDILTESDGKALVIANLILDNQEYSDIVSNEQVEHNGGVGYSSNYELSNIRLFINDIFYNTAFNDLQKELIEQTEVDNSVSTTSSDANNYICNNTSDMLFLLSYSEVNTYYKSSLDMGAYGSDYAKCQGLIVSKADMSLGYSSWTLRSPKSAVNRYYAYKSSDSLSTNSVTVLDGVRPACWINL